MTKKIPCQLPFNMERREFRTREGTGIKTGILDQLTLSLFQQETEADNYSRLYDDKWTTLTNFAKEDSVLILFWIQSKGISLL